MITSISAEKKRLLNSLTLAVDRLKTDDMVRHGSIMIVFSLAASLFNYLYNFSMAYLLTPVQYGTLASLLSLLGIMGVFSRVFITSVTKFTSKFKAQHDQARMNYLWSYSLKQALLLGTTFFLVTALISPLISRFLNMDNFWYVIVFALTFTLILALPVNWGVLGGLQRFFALGSSNTLLAVLKVLFGIGLVYLGLHIYGGLLSLFLAHLAVFITTLVLLRGLSRAGKKEFEVHSLHAYAWPVFLAVLCFATLTNLDVTLAKHFLSPYDAGNYATVSLLGKIVFFLPGGIVIAMFPKTSELFESRVSPAPVMIKAVLFTLISAGFVVAIYGLFPDALVAFLFKDKYPLVAPHLFRYGLAMLFLTLANVLMSYFLSLNQTKVAWAVTIAVTVQLALMFAFHDSIEQIVNVVLVSAAFGLVLMSLFLFRSTKRCSQ